MKHISNFIIAAFLLFSFLGFADATYLTAKHYAGVIPPCSLINGCETVLTSAFATMKGIPIALGGAFYYLTLFIAGIVYVDTRNPVVIKTAAYVTAVGFLTSVVLISLQIFVIRALCLYCIFSATTSVLLFILGIYILTKLKNNTRTQQSNIQNGPMV